MPAYKVKPEPDYGCVAATPDEAKAKKKRFPCVSIPVSPEIISALEVGKPVTVQLQGTVRGLEMRQSTDSDPWSNRNELRVELRMVEADAGEESEEEDDSDDESGEPTDMKSAIEKQLGYAKK